MSITVYSKPNCVQCKMTKRYLTAHHQPFTEIDVSEDQNAVRHLKVDLGFQATPVVESTLGTWSGFQPDKLRKLVG